MPLIMVGIGETCTIQRIGGSEETEDSYQTSVLYREQK